MISINMGASRGGLMVSMQVEPEPAVPERHPPETRWEYIENHITATSWHWYVRRRTPTKED